MEKTNEKLKQMSERELINHALKLTADLNQAYNDLEDDLIELFEPQLLEAENEIRARGPGALEVYLDEQEKIYEKV